ncbi:MAG: tetratricopeptide repeat protein, partial [Spirulinaceae cyanobacterium]
MWKRIKQLFQGKPTPEPVDRKKEFSVEKYTEDQNTNTVNQEIKPNFSVGLSREESTQISDSYWQTEIENLSQALNLNPQDYVAYCDRGIIYCDMLEQYKNAVSDFTKAIEIKPDLDNLWFNRGQAYLGLKEYENAISDYAEALKINPSNSSTYNNRGHAYKEIKEYEKAIADFTQVLKLVSNNSNAYNNRGIAYGEIKEYEKAIADFTQAINLDRNFSYAYNNRGNAYRDIKEYEKAIADFTQAINLDLNFSHAYTNRGLAYDEITEYKKAIADFTQAIELDPNDCNTYSNRGLTYREIKENESAIADLTQALRLNPNDCNTYNNRGLTYCDIEEYSKAIADFTQAIQLDPKYYPAWVNKGMCFEIVRSYHVALENYDEGLSHLDPQTEPLGCAMLHWHKGITHYNHGKTQPDARRYFALATQEYSTAYNLIEADPLHTPDTLNILKNWIIALRALGWEEDADALTLNAIQRLNNYLIQADPLYRKVLRYEVYTLKVDVDILATINSPQSHWEALQEAE